MGLGVSQLSYLSHLYNCHMGVLSGEQVVRGTKCFLLFLVTQIGTNLTAERIAEAGYKKVNDLP